MSSAWKTDITDDTGVELKSPPINKGKSIPCFLTNSAAFSSKYKDYACFTKSNSGLKCKWALAPTNFYPFSLI